MSASKCIKRFLVVVVAVANLGIDYAVFAGKPEPVQRVGRFFGAGWGDGYHACETSGFRPAANLPPKSYYQRYGHSGCLSKLGGGGATCSSAFGNLYGSVSGYGTKHCSHGGACDQPHCDSPGCDSAYATGEMSPVSLAPGSLASGSNAPGQHVEAEAPTNLDDARTAPLEATTAPATSSESLRDPMPPAPAAAPKTKRVNRNRRPAADRPSNRSRAAEELPAPKKPTLEAPLRPSDAKSGPSTKRKRRAAPEATDGAAVWSTSPLLASDLLEAQQRPIRPLPPTPKRELSRPKALPSTNDSMELLMPRQIPFFSPGVPNGESLKEEQAIKTDAPSLKANPFVDLVPEGSSPTRIGHRVDKAPRVAEVPAWMVVKQPR